MFDQQRLRDYGTNASRASKSNKSNDEMNKKEGKIAHPGILSKLQNRRIFDTVLQFARDTPNLFVYAISSTL
jgi:hypothetical protein